MTTFARADGLTCVPTHEYQDLTCGPPVASGQPCVPYLAGNCAPGLSCVVAANAMSYTCLHRVAEERDIVGRPCLAARTHGWYLLTRLKECVNA